MAADETGTTGIARSRVAAGLLIRDVEGQILMVKPTYKEGWDIPGGYLELGESPRDACAREVQEELGCTIEPGSLLVVDWAPHPAEGDKLLFIFDGGVRVDDDPALRPDGQEIAEARFWPTTALDGLTPARLARRLHVAATAAVQGASRYAEHGRLVEPQPTMHQP